MPVPENLKNIVEAALLAAGGALSLDTLQTLFEESEMPDKKQLRETLKQLSEDYTGRGIEIADTFRAKGKTVIFGGFQPHLSTSYVLPPSPL